MSRLVMVWKVPKDTIEDCPYAARGIYTEGELMGVHRSEDEADAHIQHLREHSPSSRFGEDMDDAPYEFTVSFRVVSV